MAPVLGSLTLARKRSKLLVIERAVDANIYVLFPLRCSWPRLLVNESGAPQNCALAFFRRI